MTKWVYGFGDGAAEGRAEMHDLLGGKGANLAEMCNLGLPVPPGFTISTQLCAYYNANDDTYPGDLKDQLEAALAAVESVAGARFGDAQNPLLLSVRSGARVSMPGMMDTVLNLGLNDATVAGLAAHSGDDRFAQDSYRRFIQMYGDVVLGVDHYHFEDLLEAHRDDCGVTLDTELSAADLQSLIVLFKNKIESETGSPFPQDPQVQLWRAVAAVFGSWQTARAVTYRRLHDIPHEWGTAVSVQAMVFGNMGDDCATGVAFTRDPSTGENSFYGEYLINAQGEDVVAGIRTPQRLTIRGKELFGASMPAMEETMPEVFAQLEAIRGRLEDHYCDMQDIEFTVQRGKLWMLQTRDGKRTAAAALKIAVDMAQAGLIDRAMAVSRIDPASLDQLLHPTLDPDAERVIIARGLPASPGAACGRVVFSADEAEALAGQDEAVILVRHETSPEDIHGMHAAKGILTARGGMTSHAAVVARGMGRPCVAGAGEIRIDYQAGEMRVRGTTIRAGDIITIDGAAGEVIRGAVPTIEPALSEEFDILMGWADEFRRLKVRTNAETAAEVATALRFGAQGIGLSRTEHMFFDAERIVAMREMIVAEDEAGRRAALDKILPMQRADFTELFGLMKGLPVTIRLLDPPLHEFLPKGEAEIAAVAARVRHVVVVGGYRQLRPSADIGSSAAARAAAGGIEPDARSSRLPAGDHLSRNLRDAGARDLRGGNCGKPANRRDGRTRNHGALDRQQAGIRHPQGGDRPGRRTGRQGAGRCAALSGRHHDRAAARRLARRCDCPERRIFQLRDQRSDPDRLWHQPRRCRVLPARLPGSGDFRWRPLRVD